MKKLFNFCFIFIIFTALFVSIFIIDASAAQSGYYTYTVDSGRATITDVDTSVSGAVSVPSSLGGYPVTEIGMNAFTWCENVTEIIIPEGIMTINDYAFNYCKSLVSIHIPVSVSYIGRQIFGSCENLKIITVAEGNAKYMSKGNSLIEIASRTLIEGSSLSLIPEDGSVTKIGDHAFNGRGITSLYIPDAVKSIGTRSFYYCYDLKSVLIGTGVTTVNAYAFQMCPSLNVYVYRSSRPSGWNLEWYDKNYTTVTWGFTCFTFDEQSVKYALLSDNTAIAVSYVGNEPNVVIGLDGYTVTKIQKEAFFECEVLESVIIKDGVTEIGTNAFSGCVNLKTVELPETLITVNEYAFKQSGLESVTIPKNVQTIGEQAFGYCNIKELTVYGSPDIGRSAFTYMESPATVMFFATPKSLYDDSRTIYSYGFNEVNLLIYCFSENTTVRDYAEKYGIALEIYTCADNGCVYDEIVNDKYIASLGSCDRKTVYYKSCIICGNASDTLTFETDYVHSFVQCVAEDKYLYSAANCESEAVYYKSCVCGLASDAHTFRHGAPLGHKYSDPCDPTCDVCYKSRTVIHSASSEWEHNSREHWNPCTNCGVSVNVKAHSYSAASDTDCDICGRVRELFKITYDANGGVGAPSETYAETFSYVTLSTYVPTRSGYIFKGWSTALIGNVEYAPGSSLTSGNNVTLYAMWVKHCNTCSGTGEISERVVCGHCINGYLYTSEICSVCNGYGTSYLVGSCPVDFCYSGTLILNGEYIGPCSTCGGDGKYEIRETCSNCEGKGSIKYPYKRCTYYCDYGYLTVKHDCEDCGSQGYIKLDVEAAPLKPVVLTQGTNSVVLEAIPGYEYSKDGGLTWQIDPEFYGLTEYSYVFCQRYAETDTTNPGAVSESVTVSFANNCVHSFTDKELLYPVSGATCTSRATYYKSCEICGAQGREIFEYGEPLPHSFTEQNTGLDHRKSPATCTQKEVYYYSCATCGANGDETFEYGDEPSHCLSTVESYDDTHHWIKCYNCDEKINMEEHDMGDWRYINTPSCFLSGKKLRECKTCSYFEVEDVSALGHDHKATVTEPTCTEPGHTTYVCNRCGAEEIGDYVEAKGHDLGEWYTTVSPTCTAPGELHRVCGSCSYSETKPAAATGDSYTSPVTGPTCTEEGYTTHICHCGKSYTDTYTEATGHDFDEWYSISYPSCTTDGELCRVCRSCNYGETKPDPATGHTYESTVTAPTCTEGGHTTHTCHCGESYTDTYTDAKGHGFGEWFVSVAATCEKGGEERRNCLSCDHFETRVTDATGHTPGAAASCTEDQTCTVCGKIIDAKKGHSYTSFVIAPACTEKGYTNHVCHCGDSYKDGLVSSNGHKYESTVTEPSCNSLGYTKHVCAVCKDSYMDSYTEKTDHKFSNANDIDCNTCGYIRELETEKLPDVTVTESPEGTVTEAPETTVVERERRSCASFSPSWIIALFAIFIPFGIMLRKKK